MVIAKTKTKALFSTKKATLWGGRRESVVYRKGRNDWGGITEVDATSRG